MRSTGSQVIRMIAAVFAVLVLGAGVAAAETVLSSDDEAEDQEIVTDDDGSPEVTLGAIVSQAAKDHSNDERCGNHGAYVSSVARGLDDCEVRDGDDAEASENDEVDEDEVDEEVDEEGEEVEDEGPPEGTHGAVVSQAAKDHSNDERCGNHGAYVSSVARGLDDCEVRDGDDADEDDEETDDADEDLGAESVEGAPERGGPPPWAGNGGRGNGRGNRD